MRRQRMTQAALLAGAFGCVYAVLSLLQLKYLDTGSGLSPVNLAAGLAVGVLARIGPRLVWSILAVTWCISVPLGMLGGQSLPLALAFATVLTFQCGAGSWLLDQTSANGFPRWERLAMLSGIATVVAFAGATAAALATLAITNDPAGAIWLTWWIGSSAGIMLVVPAVLVMRLPQRLLSRRQLIELLIACLLGVVLVVGILGADYKSSVRAWGAQYLLAPLLLWFAVRFGLMVTALATCAVDFAALAATNAGFGPFAAHGLGAGSLLWLQLVLLIIAMAIYAVAINTEQRRRSDNRLASARSLVDSLLNNSDAMISIREYSDRAEGLYVMANPRFARAAGRTVDEIVGSTERELSTTELSGEVIRQDLAVLAARQSRVFLTRSKATPGDPAASSRVYLVTKFPVMEADGRMRAVGSIALDITEHRRRERLMRLTFDQSPVPMVRMAWRNGRPAEVLDANRSLASLLGVPVASLLGHSLDRFVHPEERGMSMVPTDGQPGRPRRREARLVSSGGDELWVSVTATLVAQTEELGGTGDLEESFALVVLEDVTARRVAEQTLTHQALHDALTGVLNRYALVDRLSAAITRLWNKGAYTAVLFCDLDGFKNLNDTLGHRAGDEVLVSVCERLRAVMRPQDTVARLGGDEFVLICEDLPSPGQARVIGERIRESMRTPFRIDGREYGITVSVGIAATTDPATKAEDLLRRADLAMYRAKDNGRNRVEYYVEELETEAVERVEATETLRRAIAEDRIRVHYQPIVDLPTGRIVAVEALARLLDESGGLVHPADFIAVAESSGLVGPLGEQVLDIALDQLVAWRAEGLDVRLNVNVSPRQLARASFAPAVFERLMTRGIPPQALCLEVTEGAVVDATGPTLITLRRLRSYGVRVGIDDFGTGYSSLTTLKYVAVDVLKIDRSFVEGLGEDVSDAAIVSAVIQVAHDLNRIVVAEGVENADQAQILARMGCDQVQGYWYGKPAPFQETTETLRSDCVVALPSQAGSADV